MKKTKLTSKTISPKERILAQLNIQEEVEGETENIKAIRAILLSEISIKSSMLFNSMIDVKPVKYGEFSFQYHHFHYLKQEFLDIVKIVQNFNI